jgi:chorismate-pyruvate lyase
MDQLQQPAFPNFLRASLVRAGLDAESFVWVAPEALPEPSRSLLVHRVDMTSTLERHHGEPMALQVLVEGEEDGHYFREVILKGAHTGTPAEFGLIEIEVAQFPENLRERILSGRQPLGGILNESGMRYVSRPLGYFSVARGDLPPKLSRLGTNETFYGRYNRLSAESGICLARIVEILPDEPSP